MSTKGFCSLIVVVFLKLFQLTTALEMEDVVILILNQQDDFNSKLAMELGDSIYKQTGKLNKVPPNVILADIFSDAGHWTIIPVLKRLVEDKAEKEWIVVCPGDSMINIEVLLETLQQFNASSGEPIPADDLYIGVKTFQGYHSDRVPVVKKTWAPHAEHIVFYSDEEDPEIPTKSLGIANVVQGHCQKTMSILDDMEQIARHKDLSWFAIVDDDTILSVGRLRQFLSCYDPSEPVVIGERYGYFASEPHGYAYPTGGAGIVFSSAAVKILASGHCKCPAPTSPDDMHIGLCLQRYSIPIVHSPLFHQARPMDYALPGTPSRPPITFHKHFLIDPLEIYAEHFEVVDNEVAALDAVLKRKAKHIPTNDKRHTEL